MSKWKLNENSINEFLWTCAGVNKNILRLYPSEYAKYAGSGGTILFTAMMAFISGSYAMFFVFSNAILSLIFGIFWALLIFNLDRFIVNSMHTDGKDTLSWKKIQTAMPRIIMAIFLGIVISTPLEMKIFNDRIESQLLKDNIERINSAKNESSDYKTISLLQAEQNQLTKDRKQLVDDLQKAQKELKEEAEGNALSGIAGHGTIYRDKETYVNQCKQSLQEWDLLHKERLTTVQKRIDEVNKHIEKFEGKIDGLREDGFSAEEIEGKLNNILKLDVKNQSVNELAETITHELALHGSDLDKIIKTYEKNGIEAVKKLFASDPEGDMDHESLAKQDKKHVGVSNYNQVKKELINKYPSIKKVFNSEQKKYEKVFGN